jgi:hypothetical protein
MEKIMEKFLTPEQVGGLVRTIGAPTLAYAIAKGWITPEGAEWIAAGAVSVAAGAWSWWVKRPK